MMLGEGLARLDGYPFEVRHSTGVQARAQAAAEVAADAYLYFRPLFGGVEPDIALIVADPADWHSRQPYGLPFFNDGKDQIRPGILVMPAGSGDFWASMADDLRQTSPRAFQRLLATYPDGRGGVDLQPFFDLITIHELGHAFAAFGDLDLPTFWLGEIFANLALHVFIATRRPRSLVTLETLPEVGAGSRRLDARMRAEGYTTLEDLERHYTGGEDPMDPLNYVWYQYRWQRIAAAMFGADGEVALVRFWNCFRGSQRAAAGEVAAEELVPLLSSEVSATLGEAVERWRRG
ncbi:MAG: hypothetical protein ACP5PW_02175 [Candidatus Dormibacteria bacterium]